MADTVAMTLQADKAAREYERSCSNPYFIGKPDDLHDMLVRIILGAHEKLKAVEVDEERAKRQSVEEEYGLPPGAQLC